MLHKVNMAKSRFLFCQEGFKYQERLVNQRKIECQKALFRASTRAPFIFRGKKKAELFALLMIMRKMG
jgi:hypothetical protein